MKILVTGASGLLGLNLSLQMHESHTIIGVDRQKLANMPFDLIKADLLDADALPRILDESKPDAVIHCAANALVDACEQTPDATHTLNAVLPGKLASACFERDIHLLHISTDAVFDGTKEGIYTEEDEPNPLGVYAQTKLDGEIAVLAANPNAAIARVNFFGWSLSGTRSLAEFFVNNLRAGKNVNGFDDVYFCPMFVGDLADTLVGTSTMFTSAPCSLAIWQIRWSGCWKKAFRACITSSGHGRSRNLNWGRQSPINLDSTRA